MNITQLNNKTKPKLDDSKCNEPEQLIKCPSLLLNILLHIEGQNLPRFSHLKLAQLYFMELTWSIAACTFNEHLVLTTHLSPRHLPCLQNWLDQFWYPFPYFFHLWFSSQSEGTPPPEWLRVCLVADHQWFWQHFHFPQTWWYNEEIKNKTNLTY